MSSSLARKKRVPGTHSADAKPVVTDTAVVNGDDLWRSAPVKANAPVEELPLTYEERRDRWRREAGTLGRSSSDTPTVNGAPYGGESGRETWRGLHP